MATGYRLGMIEAVRALGIKKAVAEMLMAAGVIKDDDCGQVSIHHNNGGITKILQTKEIK